MNLIQMLKDWWNKKQKEKKEREEYKRQLEKEVMDELRPEIKEIQKQKLKEQMRAKMLGEKKNPFAQLGEDFKKSNLGSDTQLEKFIGGRRTGLEQPQERAQFNTDKILGGTQRDFNVKLRGRPPKQKDITSMIGGGTGVSNEKLKQMASLTRKKK